MGEGVGGLLCGTFRRGESVNRRFDCWECPAGLGAAMLAGGLRRSEQHFNAAAARAQATMLMLAAIALVLPAAFQTAAGATAEGLNRLSISMSVAGLHLGYHGSGNVPTAHDPRPLAVGELSARSL